VTYQLKTKARERMNPYYQDSHRTVYNKSSLDMSEIPDETIQCCVTSPPYYGLRRYEGNQDIVWDGDPNCEHDWVDSSIPQNGGVGDYEVGRVGNAAARSKSHERKESCQCPDCGRPFMELRKDLTEKELEFVMGELKRCGLI
jgi:hypothetical protein